MVELYTERDMDILVSVCRDNPEIVIDSVIRVEETILGDSEKVTAKVTAVLENSDGVTLVLTSNEEIKVRSPTRRKIKISITADVVQNRPLHDFIRGVKRGF
jgi:hypothetical protein